MPRTAPLVLGPTFTHSLPLRDGEAAAKSVTAKLRIFKRVTSLSSVGSLAERRASVEGPRTLYPGDRVRLWISVEHVDDPIGDIEWALFCFGGGR